MYRVSVIIPVHNAARFIGACLESLKEQTFKDYEVIVVDDASTDETVEIASKYAKVIKSLKNQGEGAVRNIGAREASGEILAFTDADVILPKDWLERLVNNFKMRNVSCVGGGYSGSVGNSFMEKFAYLELKYRRKELPEFVKTLVSNNFACLKSIFFECGGFPQEYKCEDLRLSFLIGRKYPILWDKNNGVFHHFKTKLTDYLKQQYFFGRDTVLSYLQYPEILSVKTHQGRGIYLETLFMFLGLLSIFLYWRIASVFFILVLLLNINLLHFLKKEGLGITRSLFVIFSRDVVCVFSFFSGAALYLKSFLKKKEKNDENTHP